MRRFLMPLMVASLALTLAGCGDESSSVAAASTTTPVVDTTADRAGPDLASVTDVASFTAAVNGYRGPYTVTSKPDPSGGYTYTSVRHFDGTNYSRRLIPGSPIDEYRIVADGPNGGPTCFITTDDGDRWIYETGSPMHDLSAWSLLAAMPDLDPTGRFERTATGFEFTDDSPQAPQSVTQVSYVVRDGRLERSSTTDAEGDTSVQRYDFTVDPRVAQPRPASNDGMDVTC